MNFDYLRVITGRKFPIEYVCAPVCEGEFSSTGSPFISLLPIIKNTVEGLEATYEDGIFTFRWSHVDGALCYSVWKLKETDQWEIVAECISLPEWTTNQTGCYRVTVISGEGESEPSAVRCTTEAFVCQTFSVLLPAALLAQEGTAVVFTVTAATVPAENLNYVWRKDGTIILSEILPSGTSSSVSKTEVAPGDDEGTYSVEVTATTHGDECQPISCACVLTVEPYVPPECEDIGDAAPEGVEAFRIPLYPPDHAIYPSLPIPIEWEFFDVSAGTITSTVTCPDPDPMEPDVVFGQRGPCGNLAVDHPPGAFGAQYVFGWTLTNDPVTCSGTPALPIENLVNLNLIEDEEFYYGCYSPSPYLQGLAEQWGSSLPPFGNLPPVGSLGESWSICSAGALGVQAYFDSVFLNNLATGPWYFSPVNWHTNTGGPFTFVAQFDPMVATNATTFQIMQFDGCIQQPRGLRFASWAAVKGSFPLDVQAWAGTFPTRTTYDYTTLRWDAASGGHVVAYTQAHPTATNGCGWILDVYGIDAFHYRALKKTGDTGDGIYLRDAAYGAGPTCVVIEEIPVVI